MQVIRPNQLRELLQPVGQMPEAALPYNQSSPAKACQVIKLASVTFGISVQLCSPELSPGSRRGRIETARMSVPEASMHENCQAKSGHHQIRLPRQVPSVKPEPISHCMKVPPHSQLRLGMLAPNRRHHSRSDSLLNDISHFPALLS